MALKSVVSMLKQCNASSKLNGNGEEWIKIMEEAEEIRIDASHFLENKKENA